MVDYHIPRNYTPLSEKAAHLRDPASYVSGDESVLPASTLSGRSDFDSSSDMTSLLMTARSTSPMSLLGESGFHMSIGNKDPMETFETWLKHADTDLVRYDTTPLNLDKRDPPSTFALEQDGGSFMPINTKGVISQRSRTPSPGISKMLLSLTDHPVERPCSPNASSLYKNTKTHCNPSELGQQTYDECMVSEESLGMISLSILYCLNSIKEDCLCFKPKTVNEIVIPWNPVNPLTLVPPVTASDICCPLFQF